MTIDLKDFRDLMELKRKEGGSEARATRAAEYLKAESVSMEKLTGDDQWDRLLSHIQPLLTTAQEQVTLSKEMLPYIIEDEKRLETQLKHSYNLGRMKAFQEVMDMPKEIVDYYHSVITPEVVNP